MIKIYLNSHVWGQSDNFENYIWEIDKCVPIEKMCFN